ncbi:hypothetical protein DSM43518_02304 [Mycobacterium marinum]|uniref:Fur family transcriptional regulator n=1 Tax=Mycobacterium marinum TaxID=1781 RepID=UPI000E3BE65D|nr:Fur family transcriptional regulator [Mycobacterium marinum]RFZ10390.1 hypothetical protein DSM43518_02304 [Mycobacterium marinum]RFZ63017.1 hypothetical protein DE4576_04956 [Mycobacterium marinum]
MSTHRIDPELIRKHLLEVLSHTDGQLTTAELRQLLLPRVPSLVNEIVYRNLIVLEHRGELRRRRLPGRRHVAWASVTSMAASGTAGCG